MLRIGVLRAKGRSPKATYTSSRKRGEVTEPAAPPAPYFPALNLPMKIVRQRLPVT